ncbi:probable Tip elongation aberrant protein 1 at C-terminar half [Coccomyxa sp. Obi]|nr:probable Tip elongation aberrant protein 1 at C-terminar half [Coccomyxa sp. Obi]
MVESTLTSEIVVGIIEDLRILGNTIYKSKQYRRAEATYKSALAIMGLSPDKVLIEGVHTSVKISSEKLADFFSPDDDLRAATLLLNLTMALLSVSTPAALREAVHVCTKAERHLEKLPALVLHYKERMLSIPPKLMELYPKCLVLQEKAFMRKGTALERCGDVAGAHGAYLQGSSEEAKECAEAMVGILLALNNNKKGCPGLSHVPAKLQSLLQNCAPDCCHTAQPWFKELAVAARTVGYDLGPLQEVFSCGQYQGSPVVMARFPRKMDRAGVHAYIPCILKGTGSSAKLQMLGAVCVEARSALYKSGAVLNDAIYCFSTLGPLYMLVWPFDPNGGMQSSRSVAIKPAGGLSATRVQRESSALVACSGSLYMVGALPPEASLKSQTNSVFKFTHDLSSDRIECSVHKPPESCDSWKRLLARYGHATWVHGEHLYIFGGSQGRLANPSQPGSHGHRECMDDMWCFNVKTEEWKQVDPLGLRPVARANMGVAYDEKRAIIMGGRTRTQREAGGSYLNLADVWEFYPDLCCWIQVVPSPTQKLWLMPRQSPAVALVSDGTVCIVGGHDMSVDRPKAKIDCIHLSITRDPVVLESRRHDMARNGLKGAWRDSAMENLCRARFVGPPPSVLSEKQRLLEAAPVGSVLMLTPRPGDLSQCALTPADASSFRQLLPLDYIFSPVVVGPLGPLQVDLSHSWGGYGCPFDVAPRWMTPPSEITTSLGTRPDKYSSLPKVACCTIQIWHTVKEFSTVKAATLFFKLHQPNIGWNEFSNGWGHVTHIPLRQDPDRMLAWDVREFSAFLTVHDGIAGLMPGELPRGSPEGLAQFYISVVIGRAFTCLIATMPSNPELLHCAGVVADGFIGMQHELLSHPLVNLRPACQHCGEPGPSSSSVGEENPAGKPKKVCRGCRMVRYCGRECQLADWPKHKDVCSRIAAEDYGSLPFDDGPCRHR